MSSLTNWALNSVDFLNHFSTTCENKLDALDAKLRQADLTLLILEAKLRSVPGLEVTVAVPEKTTSDIQNEVPILTVSNTTEQVLKVEPIEESDGIRLNENEVIASAVEDAQPTEIDPRIARFMKMLSMGVPELAVKQKMQMEGLDPNLLKR